MNVPSVIMRPVLTLDTGFGGLVGVRAAVASHGAHADAVAEGDVVAEDDWLEELCHCFFVSRSQGYICDTRSNMWHGQVSTR